MAFRTHVFQSESFVANIKLTFQAVELQSQLCNVVMSIHVES